LPTITLRKPTVDPHHISNLLRPAPLHPAPLHPELQPSLCRRRRRRPHLDHRRLLLRWLLVLFFLLVLFSLLVVVRVAVLLDLRISED
jgi:hypothetical protein